METIQLDETLSAIKENLAEQTIYSEQQIYENAFEKIKQNDIEYFFIMTTYLTQSEIQRFAASFAFLPHYSTKYGYLFSKLHGINMPFPTTELVWEIYNSAVKQISYITFLSKLYDVGYDLIFEKENKQNSVLSEQALILKKELAYFSVTGKWEKNDFMIENVCQEQMLSNFKLWESINHITEQQKNVMICIIGEAGSGKKFLAKQYTYENHSLFLCCKSKNINQNTILTIIAAAMIYRGVICIEDCENIEYDILEEVFALFEKYSYFLSTIFLLGQKHFELPKTTISCYHFETETLTREQRVKCWNYFLKLQKNISVELLANKRIMTQGQIKQSALLANQKAILEKCDITQKLIESCCDCFHTKYLSQKAVKIKSAFEWEQLILPKEQKELLIQICNRVAYEHIVYDEWGYDALLPYGRGVSMLFAGKPGTGKTMAAQVMSKQLGLEVYRVDLSQIVSKYIGETEKNINAIFDEANKSNVILFFDEMDALFGKRTDVKSANDRYINMEVSFLLQKMENYGGISILATNHLEQVDSAFFRRIQYIVSFPFPSVEQRYELWKSFITKKVPLEKDIDLQYLSEQFEMAGGSIKNAILTALFLAAGEHKKCSMMHILKGIKQELQKQGKVVLSCDFGKYENLFLDCQ